MDPADWQRQCPYVCRQGTYVKGNVPNEVLDTLKAPCNPVPADCPTPYTSCSQSIKQCRKSSASACEPTSYVLDHVVNGVGGMTTGQVLTIASAHQGSVLYVSMTTAMYSMSTFQKLQQSGGGGAYDGAGMTLIAGQQDVAGRVDSALGANARFHTITASTLFSWGGQQKILVTDIEYLVGGNLNSIGWIRSIDVSTRNYAVATLSDPIPTEITACSVGSFIFPRDIDALYGTPFIVIADSVCATLQTYDASSGQFVLTAGSPGASGSGVDFDGACLGVGAGLLGDPGAVAWSPDGSSIFVAENPKGLRRISSPNTPQCTMTTITPTDHAMLWPGASDADVFGGMIMDTTSGNLIIVAGWEARLYSPTTTTSTRLAGQYVSDFPLAPQWQSGIGCNAQVGRPTGILRHYADRHGGDNAIYLVNTGTLIEGVGPSIWRISMPCPAGWYWSGDGLCSQTVPAQRCEQCSSISPTCSAASSDSVTCSIFDLCTTCYGVQACSAGQDAYPIACSNGPERYPGDPFTYRYTSSPLPSSANQTTCPYDCFNGYYGYTCSACPTGTCPATGIRRRECGGSGGNNTSDGVCALPCTPIQNAVFTGGADDLDNCPFQCNSSGFYTPPGTRTCLACNQSRSCPVGQYRKSCTASTDTQCAPCAVNIKAGGWKYTGPGTVDNDPRSCPLACDIGYFLLNITGSQNQPECSECLYQAGNPYIPPYYVWTSNGASGALSCSYACANQSFSIETCPGSIMSTPPTTTSTPLTTTSTPPVSTTTPRPATTTASAMNPATTPIPTAHTTPLTSSTPIPSTTPMPVATPTPLNVNPSDWGATSLCNATLWGQVQTDCMPFLAGMLFQTDMLFPIDMLL